LEGSVEVIAPVGQMSAQCLQPIHALLSTSTNFRLSAVPGFGKTLP